MLTVFGPHSQTCLEEITGVGLGQLPPYHTLLGDMAGHEARIIHRPLRGLPGFDLVLPPEAAPATWQQLTGTGITPVGLEAYQAVRVRHAVPLYGHEMGDAYNPLEAGLIGSVDFHKGCYIGQEVIARLDTYQKVQKRLVMLRFSAEAAVSEGASLERNDQAVGAVTSVTRVPTTGQLIGLGYVRTASAAVGTRLELAAPASGWAEIEGLPQLFGPGEG
jgi:folate-binding protein YgfZ